jgi:hypothetical protein
VMLLFIRRISRAQQLVKGKTNPSWPGLHLRAIKDWKSTNLFLLSG